jgi:hypothetical protein
LPKPFFALYAQELSAQVQGDSKPQNDEMAEAGAELLVVFVVGLFTIRKALRREATAGNSTSVMRIVCGKDKGPPGCEDPVGVTRPLERNIRREGELRADQCFLFAMTGKDDRKTS